MKYYVTNKKTSALYALVFLFFLFVFFPVGLDIFTSQYDRHRIAQVVLLVGCSSLSSLSDIPQKIRLPIIVAILFVTISVFLSDNQEYSFFGGLHWVLLICSAAFVYQAVDINVIKFFLYSLVCIYVVYLLFAFLNTIFAFLYSNGMLKPELIYSFGDNIRFFNQWQVFVVPVMVVFSASCSIFFRGWLYLAISFSFFLLIIGGARGASLAVLVTLFFMVRVSRYRRVSLISLFVFVVVYVLLWSYGQYVGEYTSHSISRGIAHQGRMSMWLELIASINVEMIFIGNGPFSFAFFERFESHPHNLLLQLFYEAGIFVTLFVFFGVGKLYLNSVNLIKSDEGRSDSYLGALFYSILCALIYSFFSGISVMPLPQTLLVLELSMLAFLACSYEKRPDFIMEKRVSIPVIFLALIYVVVVGHSYSLQVDGGEFKAPGYWLNGFPYI